MKKLNLIISILFFLCISYMHLIDNIKVNNYYIFAFILICTNVIIEAIDNKQIK